MVTNLLRSKAAGFLDCPYFMDAFFLLRDMEVARGGGGGSCELAEMVSCSDDRPWLVEAARSLRRLP